MHTHVTWGRLLCILRGTIVGRSFQALTFLEVLLGSSGGNLVKRTPLRQMAGLRPAADDGQSVEDTREQGASSTVTFQSQP